ncbi:suppressor of fused domain protein [Gilvimarinus sp. DA14]|uniref:suppressor of fused domain protein n=1 Tax=Gilvimarinus sp. DA14 TaxID=2956798 RepID=UPI0020B85768|nr:suppressor of fused domain protein [Gilvimarinus sp. DA14]UTF60904.1 suppressor of fused domain protein [Gilvimarinus sp. DA14]
MSTEVYDQTNEVRDTLFSSLGNVDPDVIGHMINPAFMGGPQWPSLRQAFSIIRTNKSIKVASNGLSDPFEDMAEPNNGFRLEVIAETAEKLEADIYNTWLFKLVYAISQQAAHSSQIADFVATHGVITMELYAEDCGLEEFQNKNGMVGVILGVESPDMPKTVNFPAEEITLVTVQILTPDELDYVAEKRAEGRKHIHELLQKKGVYHRIELNRKSVLENGSSKWKLWEKS